MARVKLKLPEEFIFSTEIDVHISDINYGGHLANDKVLAIAHEARIRFLQQFDFSEKDIDGAGLIMTDAAIVYKSEAFHGDRLLVEIAIEDVSRIGFDLLYKISHAGNHKEVAQVKTGMAFFDYENRKITSVPTAFKEKFGS